HCNCVQDRENSGGRNLVVCIDGTSNQFGERNTNVIELYSQVEKGKGCRQLTYYNSGIGTYAQPSWKSLGYWRQVIDHKIDLAIAWNFERIILNAFRWLAENYQEGDIIYLAGFSRGAYQVRVLAAMIHKVGLIHKGNEEQIPFAYELYVNPESGEPLDMTKEKTGVLAKLLHRFSLKKKEHAKKHNKEHVERHGKLENAEASKALPRTAEPPKTLPSLAERFKKTFSWDVKVHFVGVWDTVSSIGVIRGKDLPGTLDPDHICYFRHALALDERRVKFLPEYLQGGVMEKPNEVCKIIDCKIIITHCAAFRKDSRREAGYESW
ncbi:hypothetical protein SERLA73DRAFT_49835, partial [Serpula lacrymans var. lacrymans S7.3]